MTAKKRVALILSGGVSLGSYIAGALDELLRAMANDGGYEIDTITGASAGATTGALIAHGLLYRGGETALRQAWVEDVDMADLLAPAPIPPGEPLTLLSSTCLHQVARKHTPTSLPAPRPSPLCAERLVFAATITNIEGLSFVERVRMRNTDGDEPFVQQRFAEHEVFRFSRDAAPNEEVWARLRKVAIASAALPFIFPPVPLERDADNVDQYPTIGARPALSGKVTFLYWDGGVFNNLPLDLAVFHAQQRDNALGTSAERLYLIVDPSREEIREAKPNPSLLQSPIYTRLDAQLLRLLGMLRAEGSAVRFSSALPPPEAPAAESFSPFQEPEVRPLERVRQLPKASPAPPPPPGALGGGEEPESFGVFPEEVVLERFRVVLPAADAPPLRGGFLIYALAAFLDQRFREYDFRRGAADARRLAERLLGIGKLPTRDDPLFYTPDADPQFKQPFARYEDLDGYQSPRVKGKTVRQVFEQQLGKRIEVLVRRAGPPLSFLSPIYAWVLGRLIMPQLPKRWK